MYVSHAWIFIAKITFITGPPTHNAGGRLVTVAVVCRRLYGGPAGGFTHAGQAMTINDSSTAARRASSVTSR